MSRNIRLLAFAAMAALAVAGCKKDEEGDVVLPSLNGRLSFDVEPYLSIKDKGSLEQTFNVSGAYHPEGGGIGVYWRASWKDENDTTRLESDGPVSGDGPLSSVTYTFPEELGTYSVLCTAFASGYYSLSATRYVTMVDEENSLIDMGLGFEGTYTEEPDSRDGKTYRTVKVGNLMWFAENLAYSGTAEEPCGIPFENSEAMSDIFGRYYTWDEAVNACPDGWRLPDDSDWLDLANALLEMTASEQDPFTDATAEYKDIVGAMMVDAKFNTEDNPMWRYWKGMNISNVSGLAVIPCGFADLIEGEDNRDTGIFGTENLFAAFWSGTGNEEYNTADGYGQAHFRYIYWDEPILHLGSASTSSFAANVRCVKDAQ